MPALLQAVAGSFCQVIVFLLIDLYQTFMELGRHAVTVSHNHFRFRNMPYSPVTGDRFAIIHADGKFIYSHNMLLDALMGTGIIGGLVFAAMYVSSITDSYRIAKHDLSYLWIVLILIQHITAGMTSSAFYLKPVITALIIFVSLSSAERVEAEAETETDSDENET